MQKPQRGYLLAKRAFDILCASIGTVVTSPLWLVAAIGIELSDPGPVFYPAQRLGKDAKPFTMYKFRSMRQGKAHEADFRGEESRIFPFGRFIRASKIDELPQLLNIIGGSMSIVGPRPAAVDQAAVTRGGEYAKACEVQAGLTGPSALYDYIYGDGIEDAEDYKRLVLPTRLELDLTYLQKMSVQYDLKMIWWTVLCILASAAKRTPQRILNELVRDAETRKETPNGAKTP